MLTEQEKRSERYEFAFGCVLVLASICCIVIGSMSQAEVCAQVPFHEPEDDSYWPASYRNGKHLDPLREPDEDCPGERIVRAWTKTRDAKAGVWNDIQPRLPPPNVNVLVWCERGVVIGYHNGLGDWYCEPLEEEPKPWRLKIKEPTHWCPIPDPPGPC